LTERSVRKSPNGRNMKEDSRLDVGANVHTFARYVAICKTEFANTFGRNWKKKRVEGEVKVVHESVVNGRKRRSWECDWALGPVKRRKTLPLAQVKAHSHPNGIPERQIELTHPLEEARTESVQRAATTNNPNADTATQQAAATQRAATNPVATEDLVFHGLPWKEAAVGEPINGIVGTKIWSVAGLDGQLVTE